MDTAGKAGRENQTEAFCRSYLRCLDPEQAARAAGLEDGYAALASRAVRRRLERMREAAAGQVTREDVVRRLAQLAFGGAGDALTLRGGEAPLEGLDLSAVAELKVTDKGGVEIKLLDRIRALETLCGLLGGGENQGAEELFRALEEAAGEKGGWEDG